MDAQLAADLALARQGMEELYSETLLLNGISYPAIFSHQMIGEKLEQGGYRQVIHMIASVALSYFQTPPTTTPAPLVTARGTTWRLVNVAPNQLTYDFTLESPSK
jgi:hypothetical protein